MGVSRHEHAVQRVDFVRKPELELTQLSVFIPAVRHGEEWQQMDV